LQSLPSFIPAEVDVPVDFPTFECPFDDKPSTSLNAREPGIVANEFSMWFREALLLASKRFDARATSPLNMVNQPRKRRRLGNSSGGMVRSRAIPCSLFSLETPFEHLYHKEPQKLQESTQRSLQQTTKLLEVISSPIGHQDFDNSLAFPTLFKSAPRALTSPLA
jgi:hypothetical protein